MSVAIVSGPTATAPGAQPVDALVMIDALKRKLVECANELQQTKEKLDTVGGALEMEKREHQLTTTKLTLLLRKRQTSAAAAVQDEATTDVGLLHQQIGLLQQQLRCSQEKEVQLREQLSSSAQQYEKLRLVTLEGFRAQRTPEPNSSAAADTNGEGSCTSAACETDKADGSVPAASKRSPPSAVVEAVRLALQPHPRLPNEVSASAQMWCRPAEHAQPRVGLTRSRSDLATTTDLSTAPASAAPSGAARRAAVPMSRAASDLSALSSSAFAAAAKASAGSSSQPVSPPVDSPSPTLRKLPNVQLPSPNMLSAGTPASPIALDGRDRFHTGSGFGYARGAISVEPPKRQRTVTSVMHSPRMATTVRGDAQA